MSSIFSKIINGEIESHKIDETNDFFAFLDINPIARGHTLVIPKKEIDVFFDLDNSLLSEILPFAKAISKAIEKSVECNRIGMMVAGLEVPHAHIHLVPITSTSDLTFANARPMDQDTLAEIASKIRANL
ncbi:HIT family protein [Candidatus Marinamargulisbacteria bacterium SCGC AAA071-K20]|nr:HIT family protein [Candidatus Marinamargulisbacteria bacterium SCGC AAA071-K20]